jgi:hypothetical protein
MSVIGLAAGSLLFMGANVADAAALTWSTAVNTTSTTTNQLRGVEVAEQAGNNSVYYSYIQTTGGNRQVSRINDSSPYSNLNTLGSLADQPKAVTTDDRGNVFIAFRNSGNTSSYIQSRTATFGSSSNSAGTTPVIGGLTAYSAGSNYYALAGFEAGGLIQRYDVTNAGAMVLDTSFGTLGSFNISGATDIRGVEVDAAGNIFAASRGDGKLYRVSADLSTVTSVSLTRAMDVALYGGNAYVTSYNGTSSLIKVYDATTLALIDTITISTLDANPYSRGSNEGWGGIDIDSSGRIWLADQHYGSTGGTQDRLLVSSAVPEPTGIALLGLGAGALLLRRRRKVA